MRRTGWSAAALAFVSLSWALPCPGQSPLTFVSSFADLGADDVLLWDQFPVGNARVPNPAAGSTKNGIGVTVSQAKGRGFTTDASSLAGTSPVIPDGERIYLSDPYNGNPYIEASSGPVTLVFARGVYGVGTVYGGGKSMASSGTISAYDGNDVLLGTFSFTGPQPTGTPAGESLLFVGVQGWYPVIRKVVIAGTQASNPGYVLLGKVLVLSTPGKVPVSFISSSVDLGAGDALSWEQFGDDGATVPNPAAGSTNHGIGVTVSQAAGNGVTATKGSSSTYSLIPDGERIYLTSLSDPFASSGPVTLAFAHGVSGVGAVYGCQVCWSGPTAGTISAYDGNDVLLGSFQFTGPKPSQDSPESLLFVGVRATGPTIRKVVIGSGSFVLGKVLVRSGFSAPGPGPAPAGEIPTLSTWGLLGFASLVGALGVFLLRRGLPLA